jgi:hypothetical protein
MNFLIVDFAAEIGSNEEGPTLCRLLTLPENAYK